MTRLFLGVDGGGTKTEFVCIDDEGQVRARAVTDTTYHAQVGVDGAIARLAEGLGAIGAQSGVAAGALEHVFFGLPAYGEDAIVDPLLDGACARLLGHRRYTCGNDMICGWAGSLGGQDGINIVAGTGSIGYGEYRGGAARVGGWGEVVGDEGSGYWIAARGLNAFTRMSDGRLPKGPMYRAIVEALALDDDLDLCALLQGERALTRSQIGALAPVVLAAADAGDAAAAAIADAAAGELFGLASALRTTLGYPDEVAAALTWSGGIVANGGPVAARLAERIARSPGFAFAEPLHGPGVGAALYARALSHRPATDRR